MSRWLVCAALVLGYATGAAAQPTSNLAEAAAAYRAAEKAMGEGRFDEAAKSYGTSYEISKDPVLFFKIAAALDKANKCPVAVTYYRRYLREAKPPENFQKLTEARIATCEGKTGKSAGDGSGVLDDLGELGGGAAQAPAKPGNAAASPGSATGQPAGKPARVGTAEAATEPATEPAGEPTAAASTEATGAETTAEPPTAEPPAAPSFEGPALAAGDDYRPPPSRVTAAWFGVAAGLALATAGSVFALSAETTEDDLADLYVLRAGGSRLTYDGANRDRYDDLVERGERYQTLAWISFGAAGAAALTATYLFLTAPDASPERPSRAARRPALRPLLSTDAAGVSASVRW